MGVVKKEEASAQEEEESREDKGIKKVIRPSLFTSLSCQLILPFHGIEIREGLTLRQSPVSSFDSAQDKPPGFRVVEVSKKGKPPLVGSSLFCFSPHPDYFFFLVNWALRSSTCFFRASFSAVREPMVASFSAAFCISSFNF